MKIIILCILSLFIIQGYLFGKETGFLSLSEMTIDKCPGETDSWIELYNSNNKNLPFENFNIICNDKVVFSTKKIKKHLPFFPQYCFVIIKFVNKVEYDIFPDLANNIITYYVKANENIKLDSSFILRENSPSEWIKKRSPGYCALYKNTKQTKENLIDFVTWGRKDFLSKFPGIIESNAYVWAIEKGIWKKSKNVYIGISPAPGEQYIFIKEAGIARINFKNNQYSPWEVIGDFPDKYNIKTLFSEGTPNPIYPITITKPRNGSILNQQEKLNILLKIDPRLKNFEQNLKIKFQIAQDPYFHDIVFEKIDNPIITIPRSIIKTGRYYTRARIVSPKYESNWSNTSTFICE